MNPFYANASIYAVHGTSSAGRVPNVLRKPQTWNMGHETRRKGVCVLNYRWTLVNFSCILDPRPRRPRRTCFRGALDTTGIRHRQFAFEDCNMSSCLVRCSGSQASSSVAVDARRRSRNLSETRFLYQENGRLHVMSSRTWYICVFV